MNNLLESRTLHELKLKGFSFAELLNTQGLQRLDQCFLSQLETEHGHLYQQLLTYRSHPNSSSSIETSEFLIQLAIVLQGFIADLFGITDALAISQTLTISHNPIASFKKYYVLKRAKKDLNRAKNLPSFEALQAWLDEELSKAPIQTQDKELAIALLGENYLKDPDQQKDKIEKLVTWCIQALVTPQGQQVVARFRSFHLPARLDYGNLVPTISHPSGMRALSELKLRKRDGFRLTDPRMDDREVQDEVNYCIYCHDHEGDFCSRGFPVKKGDPDQGFKQNPSGVLLTGCPLEEKVSEMNRLKRDGETLASLAVVMIDNPMCPATGHRICNDCMKACIYQKQEPVNIPQIETRVLTDVLALPWGVEIYDLLTRWNPLRPTQWVMRPYNGLKVMIAGLGPAGFTLAHHLLLEGFAVVAFDGLKIEPLPREQVLKPVRRFSDLTENLDERIMAGFGGVAEYGITVRWDKNFLKLIYLSLSRKPYFQAFGSVRFGGTIHVEDAWKMGFHHLAVAVGAGLPKALSVPNSMAPGMRQANDFLMALQLGNAAKSSSLTNLQIRLPAIVIGGGLTGVDTATELQAYYLAQVEKIKTRFERLAEENPDILAQLPAAEQTIMREYLAHADEIAAERGRAQSQNEAPNFVPLLQKWGGVTIAYRRRMEESPAYINNHEELKKALEEGIFYAEGLEPGSVVLDEFGFCKALICYQRYKNEQSEWMTTDQEIQLPARSILVATGTQPNIAYEFEHRGTFHQLNLQYQHYEDRDGHLSVAHGAKHCKDPLFGPFTSYQKNDLRVSLIGDTHPVFHGSVVKAIASGMRTFPKIVAILKEKMRQGDELEYQQFAKRMADLFYARVKNRARKNNQTVELTIKAPLAAKHFKAGEFYRLQNFEIFAKQTNGTKLQMEPLAIVPTHCDQTKGELTFLIRENNANTKLCATIDVDEPVSLMGPTGVRAKIPRENETVLIIGDHFSLPFLRGYGKDLRAAQNRVLFISFLIPPDDLTDITSIFAATNQILWVTTSNNQRTSRPQDLTVNADHLAEVFAYHQTFTMAHDHIELSDVDRIYLVGNTNLLRKFKKEREFFLQKYFIKRPPIYGSVYGNMQCMLKGVCAQCLQWQIDPDTGKRSKAVFACSWQDQPLELIDIDHIDARSAQNRVHEYLNHWWVDYLLKDNPIKRV
mgnify:CR=1 FL=1